MENSAQHPASQPNPNPAGGGSSTPPPSPSSESPKKQNSLFSNKILLIATALVGVFAVILIVAYFLLSQTGEDTANKKVYKIGVLSGLDFFADTTDGFKAKMTELGYTEGKNITYDVVKAPAPVGNKKIVQAFIDEGVDLILTFPTEASIEAKDTAKASNIPLLFTNANIEGVNLIDNIQSPGGNITGVRYPGPDLAVNRLELILDIIPDATTLLVPYQEGYANVPPQMEAVKDAAKQYGVEIIELPASSPEDLTAKLADKKYASVSAVLLIAEPLTVIPDGFDAAAKFADSIGVPIGGSPIITDNFASLFGVSTVNKDVGAQAAVLADKILKGTPAGTIPVVSADPYFILNNKEAKRLGIELSTGILARADEIIR